MLGPKADPNIVIPNIKARFVELEPAAVTQETTKLADKLSETTSLSDAFAVVKHLGGSWSRRRRPGLLGKEYLAVDLFGETHEFNEGAEFIGWVLTGVVPRAIRVRYKE